MNDLAWVHKCGATYAGHPERCPGCGGPILPELPPSLIEMTRDMERWTGLDRARISILGAVAQAYIAGWKARDNIAEGDGAPDGHKHQILTETDEHPLTDITEGEPHVLRPTRSEAGTHEASE